MPIYTDADLHELKRLVHNGVDMKEGGIWTGSAWRRVFRRVTGPPVLFAEPFGVISSDIALSGYTGWVDRANTTAVYAVDAQGLYQTTATERPMNCYTNSLVPKILFDQWATVEVVTLPSSNANSVGVVLRHSTTEGLLVLFGTSTVRIRFGATNSTATGTLLATYTLASTLKVGDVIGARVSGSYLSGTTVEVLRNGVVIETLYGAETAFGGFPGVAISALGGKVKNFQYGAAKPANPEFHATLTERYVLPGLNAYYPLPLRSDPQYGAAVTVDNGALIIPETGTYSAEIYALYVRANGTQRARLLKNGIVQFTDTESAGASPSRASETITAAAGDRVTMETTASQSFSNSNELNVATGIRLTKI